VTLSRQTIVETARSWLGTPYRHLGRRKDRHVDCVGLIIGVGAELGMTLIAPDDYAACPSSILWGFDRNEAQHFAIMGENAGRLTMIHAFSRAGKVVEHGWDSFWQRRLVGVYEFPGTEPLEAHHG
jgi:cell wall-associated NlpC family hydrolase